ncbi:MAG TPA: hypothetical protein PKG48_13780, partial [Bacteroidales bacterium]|nr:hypothetical protein [Bacteroidales bacterium]
DDLARLTCWFYILIAVLAVMPILTGDGAGEIVKTYPGISNDVIELHETWGYIFFYGLLVNGILGLVALWLARKNKGFPIQLGMICLIVAVVLMFFAWKAGMTGGEIRHPEILQGTYPGL